VGYFPPYGDLRIIWTGVEKGRDEAVTLIEATKRHLTMITGVTEKKDISPHLTFGRVRTNRNIGVLTTQLHKFANLGFGIQLVDKILVMESKLKPTGPIYTILKEINLGEPKK
jgi:RNA 2',3'-cyclic 3'-phosphodiesterase